MHTDFSSAKLSRELVQWLKIEAAMRGVPIYELVEELIANALGGARPCDPPPTARAESPPPSSTSPEIPPGAGSPE